MIAVAANFAAIPTTGDSDYHEKLKWNTISEYLASLHPDSIPDLELMSHARGRLPVLKNIRGQGF